MLLKSKKIIVFLFCCISYSISIQAQTTIQGDLNKDGKLDVADIILLKKIISAEEVIPILRTCDMNHDNKLDDKDVSAMENRILNDSVNSYLFPMGVPSTAKTGLPVVFINTPNDVTVDSKEVWVEGTYLMIVDEKGDTIYDGFMSIKGRGNHTWEMDKKPYNIKLAEKSKILGMPKHKRWCLLANYRDKSLIRNDISFELARRTELGWEPHGKHVELVFNGQHVGNYYLCEQIRIDKNRINIREMSSEDEEGENITGGYRIEVDTYYDEKNKFKSSIRQFPYQFKDPDEDILTTKQFEYFESYIDTLEHTLYEEERLLNHEYENYMDVYSFIDYWFVNELASNNQINGPKSLHLYKDKNGKLTAGPVWDLDNDTYTNWKSQMFIIKDAFYYDALFKDPSFVLKVKERWNKFKDDFETLPAYIDQYKSKLAKSQAYNYSIWPIDPKYTDEVNMSLDSIIDRIITVFKKKLAFMDKEINNM